MKTENKPQKKMGRPRVFKEPLTNAERQKRWRERVKAEAHQLLAQVKEAK